MSNAVQERPGAEQHKTYNKLREELEMLKVQDIGVYNRSLEEVAYWALGLTTDARRNEKRLRLYPSFSDEDFMRLLNDLGEEDRLLQPPSKETEQ